MRSKKFISINIAISFISKGVGLVINFVLFKILLDCIGQNEYGIWLTLSSVFAWFSFFDMGIGNGLKNKLTVSIALGELQKARSYVSTSYFMYAIIFTIVSLLFFLISHFVDWEHVLGIQKNSNWSLSNFISLILMLFGARFVLNLIISVSTAQQISAMVDIQGFFINVLILVLCIGAITLEVCSFYSIAFIHTSAPILVLGAITLFLFKKKFKFLSPTLKTVSRESAIELFSLGNQFLILQLSSLFLMTSATVLINWFMGSEEVVIYTASFRYFSIISIGFQTLSFPFWAAFTHAFTNNDILWIKKTIKQLLLVWFFFVGLGVLFLSISDWVYFKWLSNKVDIPFSLSLLLMIQVLVTSWNNIFVFFCNAVGALKIQIALSVIAIILNIPLAYIMSVVFDLGTNGIVITSIFLQLLFAIFLPFQVKKIINLRSSYLSES